MSADNILAEALARIEHKLDLILSLLVPPAGLVRMSPVGEQSHVCPLCSKQVAYTIDVFKGVVARNCGCGTGKQAPLSTFTLTPPAPTPRTEIQDGSPEEDGNDPNRRSRKPGSR